MGWKVLFFQTARGDSPVEDFIKEQDEATYAKVLQSILLLTNSGPFLKPPYIKKLQATLYELRISGKVAIRIFYTMFENQCFEELQRFQTLVQEKRDQKPTQVQSMDLEKRYGRRKVEFQNCKYWCTNSRNCNCHCKHEGYNDKAKL